MSRHEWPWRTGEAMHRVAERTQSTAGAPRWHRGDIRGLLTKSALDECKNEIGRGNWVGLHQALAAQMTARRARFTLDPASAPALRNRVLAQWPDARQDAAD